eukprot:scaffold3581_cov417-Prasinococcus_capsulatus_cf.AAC.18
MPARLRHEHPPAPPRAGHSAHSTFRTGGAGARGIADAAAAAAPAAAAAACGCSRSDRCCAWRRLIGARAGSLGAGGANLMGGEDGVGRPARGSAGGKGRVFV